MLASKDSVHVFLLFVLFVASAEIPQHAPVAFEYHN